MRRRLAEASDNPSEFVGWFTSSEEVAAHVMPRGDRWKLSVDGPLFRAVGSTRVEARSPGSTIAVDLEVRGKGFLASAAVALAAGKIEGEATQKLQAEFGTL